jgi:hypothetical protein
MKVLILVLSARREPWGELLECSKATWDSVDHPQTKTMYYCGKGGIAPGEQLNPAYVDAGTASDIFYSPTLSESLEDVSKRTLEAFEFSLKLKGWNLMARTHSSTYVHKHNLVEFIETLPNENVLCGLLTGGIAPFLWGGGSYIISRDVIEKIVANKQLWNFGVMEDNGLTEIAQLLQIPFMAGRMASIDQKPNGYLVTTYGAGEGFVFTDWTDVQKLHPHFYLRCKQDFDRTQDVRIFRELFRHYR